MGKITFRADDDLVERVERLDASKSEVMREALRAYLDGPAASDTRGAGSSDGRGTTLDELVAGRVDELVTRRLDDLVGRRLGDGGDVNVDVNVEGVGAGRETSDAEPADEPVGTPEDAGPTPAEGEELAGASDAGPTPACGGCGTELAPDHVFCPNCGEKAGGRVFCDCGDELRSDWAFCPSCGRRTPAADVLDGP